ncbi:MAG: MFS transporter [Deltaproteobacteria bacterium]|nr:MFS transporter [Deltaproteobacteria bacterium]
MTERKRDFLTKPIVGWALYDWANSAFTTTVMAGFFPIFFKSHWSAGADAVASTARLGFANAFAGIIVAISAPLLGAIADRAGVRKKFLAAFAALGITATASLFIVPAGSWIIAVLLYSLAVIGFSGGNVYYDSLITVVAPKDRLDFVSSLGFAVGYLGGGLLFALNVWMVLKPETFGLRDSSEAVRWSFLTVSIWWTLFSVPLLLFVREPLAPFLRRGGKVLRESLGRLGETIAHIRRLPGLGVFLLAYWLYIDGVDTIIRMALDYGLSLGFKSRDLIAALLMVQFIGFPAALVFGAIGERIGTKKALLGGIFMYLLIVLWGSLIKSKEEFYVLALMIGLVQGGVQALSRAFYARLVPAEQSAQYFGFYNMLNKFSVVLGPLLVGAVALLSRSFGLSQTAASRLGILSVAILFVGGGLLLRRVDDVRS